MPRSKIDEYDETSEKIANEARGQDLKLWHAWNDGGRKPEDLHPLLQRFNGLVNKTVTQRAKGLAQVDQTAARGVVMQEVIKGIQTYDPSRGASLMTHVFPRTNKASRTLNVWKNVAYIPQEKAERIGDIQRAEHAIREEGKEPTPEGIRSWMSSQGLPLMTAKQIRQTQQRIVRDVPGSSFESDPVPQLPARIHEVLPLLRAELSADEQRLFDLAYHDTNPVSAPGMLAQRLGWSPSKVSRTLSSISTKLMQFH